MARAFMPCSSPFPWHSSWPSGSRISSPTSRSRSDLIVILVLALLACRLADTPRAGKLALPAALLIILPGLWTLTLDIRNSADIGNRRFPASSPSRRCACWIGCGRTFPPAGPSRIFPRPGPGTCRPSPRFPAGRWSSATACTARYSRCAPSFTSSGSGTCARPSPACRPPRTICGAWASIIFSGAKLKGLFQSSNPDCRCGSAQDRPSCIPASARAAAMTSTAGGFEFSPGRPRRFSSFQKRPLLSADQAWPRGGRSRRRIVR
ncbi:MAG: hypothetical protein MZV64_28870 [Ignavibacteriales bacterium]|nr:hypothetical protein [Ignavibacteriales bacterium]